MSAPQPWRSVNPAPLSRSEAAARLAQWREHHEAGRRESWPVSAPRPRVIDPRVSPPAEIERLRPLTETVLAFARRFRGAHWTLVEIAWLFDVAVDDLAEALEPAHG